MSETKDFMFSLVVFFMQIETYIFLIVMSK